MYQGLVIWSNRYVILNLLSAHDLVFYFFGHLLNLLLISASEDDEDKERLSIDFAPLVAKLTNLHVQVSCILMIMEIVRNVVKRILSFCLDEI